MAAKACNEVTFFFKIRESTYTIFYFAAKSGENKH